MLRPSILREATEEGEPTMVKAQPQEWIAQMRPLTDGSGEQGIELINKVFLPYLPYLHLPDPADCMSILVEIRNLPSSLDDKPHIMRSTTDVTGEEGLEKESRS
ncbi:uncharacterized protein RCC_03760 [Ramularia collo-cygni]|uniref:Uncharacterized protein n=1 Tax=Ramularia collo-cygni TaxID=112498 RepID=A0A2D3UNW0_9PEZI|nr:uncharacterized protein RCC_03760 [Ramularia collo-cygni]CZT17922.1 uncharacterized protein RCC_03760 [Ramularia collo-cygni]